MKINRKTLIIAVLVPLLTGGLASLISQDSMKDFEMLNQPPMSPPSWLFPVVWTILYVLMGIASYLVFTSQGDIKERKKALIFYIIQLFFNFTWTIIFFKLENYLFAFIWIVVLWVLILITTIKFFGVNKCAGWLMLPYLLWVAFALYLNLGVFLLN